MLLGKQQYITKKNMNWVNWVNRELGEPVELGELGNSKPRNLKKQFSAQNIAYCRTATCKTCKFRPLSDRPTVETDVQNRRCTTSIYIDSFQIGFSF